MKKGGKEKKERKEKRKKGRGKERNKFFRNTKSIKLTKITTIPFTNGSNLMSF